MQKILKPDTRIKGNAISIVIVIGIMVVIVIIILINFDKPYLILFKIVGIRYGKHVN